MRPVFPLSLVFASVVAAACGRDTQTARAPQAASGVATADASRCPATAFDAFLTAFAERPALQPELTRYPLAYVTVDNAGDEPAPRERRLSRDSVPAPLFPTAAERARDGLELRIDSTDASRRVVTVRKPDTDMQVEYTFGRRADRCWELTRYYDQTL